MEKVSVIVPIFNQEKYLDRSVNSILHQTWTNLEIILVNDGSTDNSLRMIRDYRQKDNRIVVVNQENQGLAGAVIAGLEIFTGNYVCFVDPDDYIDENFIEIFMKEICNYDFVAMGYYTVCEKKTYHCRLVEEYAYTREELILKRDVFYNEFGKLELSKRFGVSRWNKLYRKELVRKVLHNYLNCKDVSLGEDSMFTFLALSYARSAKTSSEINGYYYDNRSINSMCRNVDAINYLKRIKITHLCFSELLKNFDSPLCQADYLYYLLGEILMGRLREQKNLCDFCMVYKAFHADKVFLNALDHNDDNSKRGKAKSFSFRRFNNPRTYYHLIGIIDGIIKVMDNIREKNK